MNFTKKLKSTLLQSCEQFQNESPLLSPEFRIKVSFDLVGFYVANLEYLFKKNIETIKIASEIHQPSILANFFHHKWDEEKGHDEWAKSDLKKLAASHTFNVEPYILDEMKDLISFLSATMRTHPVSYIAYFYYAEFITAQLGPQWMSILQAALGIEPKEVSALSKHIELDDGHADEVLDFLSTLELPNTDQERIFQFLKELNAHYAKFFERLSIVGVASEKQRFPAA